MQKVTTPVSVLEWVTIDGDGKENLSGKMKYVASAVMDADSSFIKAADEFWEKEKPKGFTKPPKSMGYYPYKKPTGEKSPDGKLMYDEIPGKLSVTFHTDIAYPDGQDKIIQLFNAKNNKVTLPEDVKIGNGSEGCVSGLMAIYKNTTPKGAIIDAGVTFYLNSIQITKLVKYEQDSGFEVQEDGWTGDDEELIEETTDAKPRL